MQAARDCVSWNVERAFNLLIVENFKDYERSKGKPFVIDATKAQWMKSIEDLNIKLANPENKCQVSLSQ